MNALEDRRPIAATTAASDNPNVIGDGIAVLLIEHPDIELASIRLIPNADGTVGIAGRLGELAGVECPQCHQPAGRPHTEYCPLAIREHVFGQVSQPATQHRDTRDMYDHRAVVRAHERDQELEDGKGGTWHQTGPDEAHERFRCDPAKCGWAPPDQTRHQAGGPNCPTGCPWHGSPDR